VPPPVVVEGEVVAVPVPRPRLTLCRRPSMPDVVERSHGGKRERAPSDRIKEGESDARLHYTMVHY
jgi:hypothetical protein